MTFSQMFLLTSKPYFSKMRLLLLNLYLFILLRHFGVFDVIFNNCQVYNNHLLYVNLEQRLRSNLYRAMIQINKILPMNEEDMEETLFNLALNHDKLQPQLPKDTPFPCDVSSGRSPKVPTSVHQLRPGDIDVIATFGDSITAGLGILSTNLMHLIIENRGVSSYGGGQSTWTRYLTLPNIIKEFNPNLVGYATGDSLVQDDEAQFNVALVSAESDHMVGMAELLIAKMQRHPKVDMENHWKLITIMVGVNDICMMCTKPPGWHPTENHKNNLIQTMRLIRDKSPRTLVAIITLPDVSYFITVNNRTDFGAYMTSAYCPCLFNEKYCHNVEEFFKHIGSWRDVEEEIADYPEFQREDFAIVTQPFANTIYVPSTPDGKTDLSYFAYDTLHLSQKSHGIMANSLWNNLLEPVGNKSNTWTNTFERFLCPTPDRPYIATRYN